ERFSLVEPPQLPEQPDKPNRILIFMLGIAASIGSGLGSVILKEGLDQTVYGSNAIRSIIKEPPLAIIPYIDRNDIKRMNITRVQITVVLISAIMLALVLVNSFMVPLDVVWYVVLRKFGLNVGEG
ncbi:MAG: lipopolysaccharide biosynthesis protein, partial [Candidatus Thiodiazotropha sp.]